MAHLGLGPVTDERPVPAALPGPVPAQGTLAAHITSAGPLTDIWIGEELSCQVRTVWAPDTAEFFPPTHGPADCGTFVAIGGVLYGPDFANHDGTAAIAHLGPGYVPFTPLSQTVFGAGTASSPFTIVTEVALGSTGHRIIQVDSYQEGASTYSTQLAITDTGLKQGTLPVRAVVYHAGDCQPAGDDIGWTLHNGTQPVGCRGGDGALFFYAWPAAKDMQDRDEVLWSTIAGQGPFADTVLASSAHDHAAGVSWEATVPSGTSALVGHLFSGFYQ